MALSIGPAHGSRFSLDISSSIGYSIPPVVLSKGPARVSRVVKPELKTLEWWISRLMLKLLVLLSLRLFLNEGGVSYWMEAKPSPWTSEIYWFQGVSRLQQVLKPPHARKKNVSPPEKLLNTPQITTLNKYLDFKVFLCRYYCILYLINKYEWFIL